MIATVTQPFEHILSKADSELGVIDSEQNEARARFQVIASELETIEARSQARRVHLSTATQTAQDAARALAKEQVLAKLAEGTDVYQDARDKLKLLEKQSKDTEKTRATLEARIADDQDKDDERLQALQQEQAACQQKLVDLEAKQDAMRRAKAQALADLGNAEHSAVDEEIARADASILELEHFLRVAKETRETLIQSGVEHLQRWPDRANQVRDLLPVPARDAATRVLSAELHYLDALLSDRNQLPDTINTAGVKGNFMSLLEVPAESLWVYEHLKGNPTQLRARRAAVDGVLRALSSKQE